MYFPDLTAYSYIASQKHPDVLNIGWLESPHPFPRKKASEALLDALFESCLHRVNQTRGYYLCQFCDAPTSGLEVSRNGRNAWLGSAEIRVEARDGSIYAAPDLIYHYVLEHDYDPPQEFVEALFSHR